MDTFGGARVTGVAMASGGLIERLEESSLKKAHSEYGNKAEIRLMTLREIGPQMGALWKNTELQST